MKRFLFKMAQPSVQPHGSPTGKYVLASDYAALAASKATAEARIAELTKLVEQYASECGECGGDGKRVPLDQFGNTDPANTMSCHECADIRAALRSPDTGSAK